MDTRVDPNTNRFCSRPWSQTTFLSDGTAVCACIDAARTNPLGNIRDRTFEEIWSGPEMVNLRTAIATGNIDSVPICRGCPNRIATPPPDAPFNAVAKPTALFLESVAACNLTCPGCDRESIEGNRDGKLVMDWSSYQKIIDSLSPGLRYMEFHLGGENFMHKQWPKMLRYAKDNNPELFIISSTNGHYFRNEKERRDLVECGIDGVIFSIDGATPETYARYRVGGRFEDAIANMRGCLEERRKAGRERPYIAWRYILFNWNDSAEEMNLARQMAREIGVDVFAWHLNVATPEFSSKRYYIGSPHLAEISTELWDSVQTMHLSGLPDFNLSGY